MAGTSSGATGTGKTFLACALGRQACFKGLGTQFHKCGLLLDDLHQAQISGSFHTKLRSINRSALLIIDDFGLRGNLAPVHSELLYELLDGRHGTGATIITSQLPLKKWHEYLQLSNPTTADAIMDRMTTNMMNMELRGASLRPRQQNFIEYKQTID